MTTRECHSLARPLMISDKMSVSSRHLFVEGAHPSGLSRVVDEGAHLVDDLGLVRHEPQKRSGFRRWRETRGVLVGIPRGAIDERSSLVDRKLPDGGEELVDGRSAHEASIPPTEPVVFRGWTEPKRL